MLTRLPDGRSGIADGHEVGNFRIPLSDDSAECLILRYLRCGSLDRFMSSRPCDGNRATLSGQPYEDLSNLSVFRDRCERCHTAALH